MRLRPALDLARPAITSSSSVTSTGTQLWPVSRFTSRRPGVCRKSGTRAEAVGPDDLRVVARPPAAPRRRARRGGRSGRACPWRSSRRRASRHPPPTRAVIRWRRDGDPLGRAARGRQQRRSAVPSPARRRTPRSCRRGRRAARTGRRRRPRAGGPWARTPGLERAQHRAGHPPAAGDPAARRWSTAAPRATSAPGRGTRPRSTPDIGARRPCRARGPSVSGSSHATSGVQSASTSSGRRLFQAVLPALGELPCIVGGHRLVSLGRWSARRRSRISSRARWARASTRSWTPPRRSSRTSRPSTGERWRSRCCCTSATCCCRSRAWFNTLRAAYPHERFQWRRILGAYVVGVGVNSVAAGARRRRRRRSTSRSTASRTRRYPAVTSSFFVESVFDITDRARS